MCNSRCTETRCLAFQSKHRHRHCKSVARKHRDKNIVFKKTWHWHWQPQLKLVLHLYYMSCPHKKYIISDTCPSIGPTTTDTNASSHQLGLNWAKLRLKNQKTHLDKTPTFKMVQKPTLTKHPPLKYCRNPP